MKVIVCLDDKGGMMFNKRRQSRDSLLRERVLALSGGRILMNEYSAKQFEGAEGVISDEAFLDKASEGDFCFVENLPLEPCKDRIEALYIYRWNRHYPGDMFFDINLQDGWTLQSTEDFEGSSHEKITEEVYIR